MRQMQLEPFFLRFWWCIQSVDGIKKWPQQTYLKLSTLQYQKIDDNEFELEFAVAGFDKKMLKL